MAGSLLHGPSKTEESPERGPCCSRHVTPAPLRIAVSQPTKISPGCLRKKIANFLHQSRHPASEELHFAAASTKSERPGCYAGTLMTDGRRSPRYASAVAIAHLTAADPKLAELIRRAGPFTLRLKSAHSPFESLLESIVYQQLHGRAAATILRRVLDLSGGIHPSPQALLDTPDQQLRGAGLSQNKMLAIRDLAAKTLDGTVPTLEKIRR